MTTKRNYIRVPILNTEWAAVVCWGGPDELRRVLHRFGYPKDETYPELAFSGRRGLCFYRSDCHPLIALPCPPRGAIQIATLSHEAVHAVLNIMDRIGAEYDTEIVAHSVAAIVRETLIFVAKSKPKRQGLDNSVGL